MEKPIITVEQYEAEVIYVRFRGTYAQFRKNSRKMFNELLAYAEKYALIKEEFTKVLTIYHDNPFITDASKLRTSIAMTVPPNTVLAEEGKISAMKMEGKYAILHYELSLGEYEQAWQYAYSEEFLQQGGYTLRDAVPFELYVTEPPKGFKGTSKTDIYIPVE